MKNENLKKQLYKEEQNEEKLITPNDFPVIYIPTNED